MIVCLGRARIQAGEKRRNLTQSEDRGDGSVGVPADTPISRAGRLPRSASAADLKPHPEARLYCRLNGASLYCNPSFCGSGGLSPSRICTRDRFHRERPFMDNRKPSLGRSLQGSSTPRWRRTPRQNRSRTVSGTAALFRIDNNRKLVCMDKMDNSQNSPMSIRIVPLRCTCRDTPTTVDKRRAYKT